MKLVFAGTPEPAVPTLKALIASGHEVIAVLTRPDARKGRGRKMVPSPVKEVALEHGIEVLTPSTLKAGTEDGDAIRARLTELAPDAIPVVAYGNLVPKDLLDVAQHGWVNLHFSLLPAWRGAAPVQAAINAGDDITGATTFQIEEGLDTGPVLGTTTETIQTVDTAGALLERLSHSGAQLMVATMDGLESGTLVAQPQQGEPTYAPKLRMHVFRGPSLTSPSAATSARTHHSQGRGQCTGKTASKLVKSARCMLLRKNSENCRILNPASYTSRRRLSTLARLQLQCVSMSCSQ